MEVTKPGFLFPSTILAQVKSDGKLVDIYHGEAISVTQKGALITPNIPIDPGGQNKTPKRILRDKRMRILQHAVSFSGVFITAIGLYISPIWYMWLFLGVHILLYIGFLHFIQPKKPKGWGIVYEDGSKKAVSNGIVRLFTKEYNKLVSTQTTDANGRYAFLVGPSQYYITIEKAGYQPYKSEDIEVKETEKDAGLVKKDVAMKKNGEVTIKES